jgi:hypothetical protein
MVLIAGFPGGPALGDGLLPEVIGARVGTNAGDDVRSDLQRYDVVGQYVLPWHWRSDAGVGLGTQVEATAGLLRNDEDSTLIAAVSPGVELRGAEDRLHVSASIGLALIPDYELGAEDFGGPVQFTFGGAVGWRVHRGLVLAYRQQHFSDAGIYGSNNRGVDMHMLELRYRFGAP